MSLLLIEGFDHYTTGQQQPTTTLVPGWWQSHNGTGYYAPTIVTPGQDSTGKCLRFTGSFCTYSRNDLQSYDWSGKTTIVVGFWYKPHDRNYHYAIAHIKDGSTVIGCLGINTSGQLTYSRHARADTNVLATSTGTLPTGTWSHVQFKVVIHDTAGSVEIKINETTDGTASSVDTLPAGATSCTRVGFGGDSSGCDNPAGGDYSAEVDDIWVDDADFLGAIEVPSDFPDADGSVNDWVPQGAGANYVEVDDGGSGPDEDSTYEYGTTSGHQSLFSVTAGPSGGAIKGVMVGARVRAESGTEQVRVICKSGGTIYKSSPISITNLYTYVWHIWETDPATSSPWTESGYNAAEFGVEYV